MIFNLIQDKKKPRQYVGVFSLLNQQVSLFHSRSHPVIAAGQMGEFDRLKSGQCLLFVYQHAHAVV